MRDIRRHGVEEVVEAAMECVAEGPVFLSVDIDVLDPAFVPGTGTPEPGGMTTSELLWACRTIASGLDIVGAELVEICPTMIGSADLGALTGDRLVREMLTGIATRRRAIAGRPLGTADEHGFGRRSPLADRGRAWQATPDQSPAKPPPTSPGSRSSSA